jgi:hypothetical protein
MQGAKAEGKNISSQKPLAFFEINSWLLTALCFCILVLCVAFFAHDFILHIVCSNSPGGKVTDLFKKMGFSPEELCQLRTQLWITSVLCIGTASIFFLSSFRNVFQNASPFAKGFDLGKFLSDHRKTLLLGLNVMVLFFILYLSIGCVLRFPMADGKLGLFGADETDPFAWTQFSRDPGFDYHHKAVHPLLLLIEVPFGSLLHGIGWPADVAAFVVNSFFGALAAGMAFLCFFLLTRSHLQAVLWAVFYGLTMSQLVFASVPEIYSAGACTIVFSYLLFLICRAKGKLYYPYWILAGIFSFGITSINFSHTLIAFIGTCLLTVPKKDRIFLICQFAGTVVFCVILLSLLQKWIFPSAYLFFSPDDVLKNTQFWKAHLSWKEPGLFFGEAGKIFFLISFVAPVPHHMLTQGGELSYFMSPLKYAVPGAIAGVAWLMILAVGLLKSCIKNPAAFWVLVSSVIFNTLFHMRYNGPEAFLYSPHIIFPLILLAACEIRFTNPYWKTVFAAFVMLVGINNILIIDKIVYPEKEFPIVRKLPYACYRQSALFR